MNAITRGTTQGLQLLINVAAMRVALVALVCLANAEIGHLPDVGSATLPLAPILGWAITPLMWLMGVPSEQAEPVK